MSFIQRLRRLFVCAALLAGLFGGFPMKPEEIEELMFQIHRQKQEQVIQQEEGENEA